MVVEGSSCAMALVHLFFDKASSGAISSAGLLDNASWDGSLAGSILTMVEAFTTGTIFLASFRM